MPRILVPVALSVATLAGLALASPGTPAAAPPGTGSGSSAVVTSPSPTHPLDPPDCC
ncbi:hypothetical protein ACIA8O_24670 [Kitasatospora sp. NPDC051853]|uniref:hypothetical protein n=1 Tax=Kitasatospora sp. NPDC051853 TaxID=3364058 RepID=UPI0037B45E33